MAPRPSPSTFFARLKPALAAFALAMGLVWLGEAAVSRIVEDEAQEEILVAHLIAQQVDQSIRTARVLLGGVALRIRDAADLETGAARAIADMGPRAELDPQILGMTIRTAEGRLLAADGLRPADGAIVPDYVRGAMRDPAAYHLDFVRLAGPRSATNLVIARKVFAADGAFAAVAAISIDLARLRADLDTTVSLHDRTILVVRADGMALFRFPDLDAAGTDLSGNPDYARAMATRTRQGSFHAVSPFDGQARRGGFGISAERDFLVVSVRDERAILRSALLGRGQTMLIGAGLLVLALCIAFYAAFELRRRRKLIDERELLAESLELVESGIAIADPTTETLVYVNRAFERLSGYSSADILGKNCRVLQGPGTDRATVAKVRAALDMGQPIRVDILNYAKDGKAYWSDLSIAPVRGTDGSVRAFVSAFSDITARVEMTTRLQASLARAQSADHAKSAFLARMSHELRTPLNAVIGFADMMSMRVFGPLNDRYGRYADDIGASGRHLLDLVERILELSRLEHDGRPLRADPVDLAEIADQAAVLARGDVETFGARLEVARDGAPLAAGDALALRQIAVNLIANAARHGKRGGRIVLRTGRAGDGGAYLSVADDGPGLPASVLANLGTPFVGERADTTAKGGLGLGLAISIELAKRMGGYLRVENAGSGALATLTLPACARDSQAA